MADALRAQPESNEDWLVIGLCLSLTSDRLTRLLDHFGDAQHIIGAPASELKEAGLSNTAVQSLREPDQKRLQLAANWLAADRTGRHLVHLAHPAYPHLLTETGEAPPCLFVEGDPDCLNLPQLAIVGSRHATPGGKESARDFAAHLGGAGLIITSGLATGIDSAAHAGALAGGGKTIAVLATGPDVIYPAENLGLAEQIREQGALISEFAPGTPVRRDQFPRRNRIISGLSLGTFVVEAGLRSGSLITARYAGNYGREIFALPGSIHSPLSKGSHRLIKQGAKLVESAADIADEIGSLAGVLAEAEQHVAMQTTAMKSPVHKDPDYAKLLQSLSHDPVSVNRLAERSGLTAEQLSSMLLILELEGRVNSLPNGCFQLSLDINNDVVSKE
ncbi:MAG: DNA-processing protein DprA [Gammaproteobacteria bacterium]